MAARPYVLAETTWKTVREATYEVAVLPWGATEAHNLHLPYGTDSLEAEHIAVEAARLAWEEGARVIVLPTIPLGVQSGQLDIPLCLHVNPSTQAAILADLAHTLESQGIRKLVILNGHGGNEFRGIIRELQPELDLLLALLDWYKCLDTGAYFDQPGDHGGEMETSLVMHLMPDLVLPLAEAGTGGERRSRLTGVRDGWAWVPRQWTQVSADTGVGDPRGATAPAGARFFRAVTERIGGFLVELAALEPDDMYE